ncbi:MAG TPA: signal peptide peptidase SppA [Dehalococcoidia bacterium]
MLRLPFRRRRVAVLQMHGTIGRAITSQQYEGMLKELADDPTVGAVVLDIDSPGGSAQVSEYLYHGIRRLNERKPVVAFIRGVGASGGYFLASGARRIVALPSALVGSIGVILARAEVLGLLDRLGIRTEVVRTGRLKGMNVPFLPITDEEREKNTQLATDVFDIFVRAVAEGRGLPEERVRELATGEAYLAVRARDLGLVDDLGDLERAVDVAAGLAGIKPRPRFIRPRRPLLQRMLGGVAREAARSALEELDGPSRYHVQMR